MIEGTAINLKCARCIHCEMCSWIKDVNDGCDWFEESKEYSYRIEIPDNATNGEVVKAMFKPNRITRTDDDIVHIDYDFTSEWWNAPYKAESGE